MKSFLSSALLTKVLFFVILASAGVKAKPKSLLEKSSVDYPGILKITSKDNPEGILDKYVVGPLDSVMLTFHLVNNGSRSIFQFARFSYLEFGFPQDSLNRGRVELVGSPPRYYSLVFPAGKEDSIHVNAIAQFCPNGFSQIWLAAVDTSDHQGLVNIYIDYKCSGSTGLKQGGLLPRLTPQYPRMTILRNHPINSSLFQQAKGNWIYSPLGARVFLMDKKNAMSPQWEDLASGFYFIRR